MNCWTVKQKRGIWLTTERAAGDDFDSYDQDSMDMDLEGELMQLLIEELSPPQRRDKLEDSDEW